MHCDRNRPLTATTISNLCKVASHPCTRDVLCASEINPLNAKLNPTCHLLALLGAHHILHVSRIRVNYHPQGDVNAYKSMDVLGNIMLAHSSI